MRSVPLAVTLLLGAAACSQPAAETPRRTTAPVVAPALRAYRDPNTGVFGEPPPGAAPAARAAARAALTEEAAPGGGRMIRLKGTFRSEMVGRLDATP